MNTERDLKSDYPWERYWAAKGLYFNKDYDTLKTMINDSDGDVRFWVAWSLYDNKDFGTLKTMINDSDRWVRYHVGLCLVDAEDWNTLEKFLDKEKDVWVKNSVERYTEKCLIRKHFGFKLEEDN